MTTKSGLIFEILPMTSIDIPEVKGIEKEAKLSVWSHRDYAGALLDRDALCFVARGPGSIEVVGFAVAKILPGAENSNHGEAEIHNIGVRKTFRRKGIGRKLIRVLRKHFTERKVGSVWLEVRESSLEAIEFYRSLSFETAYKRPDFYRRPAETAVVMRQDIVKNKKACQHN